MNYFLKILSFKQMKNLKKVLEMFLLNTLPKTNPKLLKLHLTEISWDWTKKFQLLLRTINCQRKNMQQSKKPSDWHLLTQKQKWKPNIKKKKICWTNCQKKNTKPLKKWKFTNFIHRIQNTILNSVWTW